MFFHTPRRTVRTGSSVDGDEDVDGDCDDDNGGDDDDDNDDGGDGDEGSLLLFCFYCSRSSL